MTAHRTDAELRQTHVLLWWEEQSREIPWRAVRDPWAVLVSEVMSQQTQVARVIPKWEVFMAAFPTLADAASAPVADIVRHWEGLGYNRRAVQLHACARVAVEEYDGTLPADLDLLMALPGIGPYTARAVLAFAYEHDVGVLDTNVGRVLARWGGASLSPVEAQRQADELVPSGAGWSWNQAMLDFGATVCTKRSPSCEHCAVRNTCTWQGAGADPAIGSAAVSGGQSRFAGSDRQGRGRLVTTLRTGQVPAGDLATVMGWSDDPERAARVAAGVVSDGLAVERNGFFELP